MKNKTKQSDPAVLTEADLAYMHRFESLLEDNGRWELTDPLDLEILRKVKGEWAPLLDPIVEDVARSLDAIDSMNALEAADAREAAPCQYELLEQKSNRVSCMTSAASLFLGG